MPLNHHYITEWYKAQSEWAAAAKSAAVTAARESAALTLLVRQLEWQKGAADAQVAYDDRALASGKTTRPGAGRGHEAEGRGQGGAGRRWGGERQNGRYRQGGSRCKARARTGLDLHQPRNAKAVRAARYAYPGAGRGQTFDTPLAVPLTIRNPGTPVGTHVFTAVAPTDGGLRWKAVTIDSADDAKDALHRVTIPQDVHDRIAPTTFLYPRLLSRTNR